jgi:hypothetical protein
VEEAIITRLLDDAGVSALVAARVFGGRRPQGSDLPSITLTRVAGSPVYVDEGEAGLSKSRIQVDCWGNTYSSAKLVARAAIEALSAFHGTIDGQKVENLLLDAERDLSESGSNVAEYLFRTSLDFFVIYVN